jgi:hypothetical protein
VESGLLGGAAVVNSSDSSDDDILDPLAAISRTGLSRLTPEEKEEVRELETAMDTHPRRQCAKMIIVTICLCGLLGVPIALLLTAFVV